MTMEKNLYRFFRSALFRRVALLVLPIVMVLLGSCRDESLTTMHPGPEISFSLSDATVRPITRTGGDREDTDMVVVDSLLGVLPLQTEDGGRELYLHAFLSGSDRAGEGRVLTRAAPVDGMGFYDSFGVLASVYSGAWDESSCFPDYMYNVMVTKSSSWTTSYYWPGGGRNVRFFAYAPYNWEGIVLSGKDVAGTPTITCSLPDDVPDQKDLLVAVSGEMPGNTSSTAPLNFRHVLTAVRFVTGDDMLPGRITKITLKNVYGKAVYPVGGTSWRDFGSVKSFSQTPDKEVSGQPGEEITGGVTTFMMIPQHLPAGASIEIAYTDGLSSTPRTLSTSIAGKIWPMGKTITYRISTTSISVVPEFSVTSSGNFTHEGGAVNYTVRSFATVSGEDGSSQKVEMKWSAEFVEEDGVGGYHAISRPFWFTGFTESGNGGVSQHRATAEAQQGVTENPHNSKLQIAEDINVQTGKTPYNLSNSSGEETVENTANCYLVNAPGIYSLPLVYDQLNQELETLKSKFMLLDTDEERKAFRSEVTAFIDSKSDEEKQLVNEAFIAGANDACARADKLIDNVLRNKLDGIYESISWSYIARTYFNKSRAWLSQRINGLMIHGKEVQFTYEEKQTLLQALRDIGKKIERTAQVIEQTL